MINVKQLNDYFRNIKQTHTQVQDLFLATFTNSILASTQSNVTEPSIYSTLLTDSHYIISFNLVQDDDKLPLEVLIELENQWIFLYNIGIHFILGGVIHEDQIHSGRALMQQIFANITAQMQHVDKWIEKDQK